MEERSLEPTLGAEWPVDRKKWHQIKRVKPSHPEFYGSWSGVCIYSKHNGITTMAFKLESDMI